MILLKRFKAPLSTQPNQQVLITVFKQNMERKKRCLNAPSGNPESAPGGNASDRIHYGFCIEPHTEDFSGGRAVKILKNLA